MIFDNLLNQYTAQIRPYFDQIHNLAGKNQTHGGDLLLVHQNASYREDILNFNNTSIKLDPYTIGFGEIGHAAHTNHNYIGEFLKTDTNNIGLESYLKELEDKSDKNRILELEARESYSIQSEMLVYLKIWESDSLIKELYQITRLLESREYDWHFRISGYSRDEKSTGTRENIIRTKIRDRYMKLIPEFYQLIKEIYKPQLRNAIAHSQYFIYGRVITLTNYDKNDSHSLIKSVTFNEWIHIFHKSIILYVELTRILIQININYALMAADSGSCQIRVSKQVPVSKYEYRELYYDNSWDIWNWERTE
jgi:hypothetical protein